MEKKIIGSIEGLKIANNHFNKGQSAGYIVDGSLIDSYFLYDVEYNNQKYDFMVLLEQYATEYSSKYLMIVSDNYEDVEQYDNMLSKELDIQGIIDNMYYDNTLAYLEEVGRISLEQVDYNIDNFIEALERETNKEYKVYNDLKGQYIAMV